MELDLNVIINLGVLGVLAFLVRGIFGVREDVRAIKTTLGINGNPAQGLLHEVGKLRESKHEHANYITKLNLEVADLKARVP